MENPYRRTWAEIDLDALVQNVKRMRAMLPAGCRMAAVVKTDGYGHGAVPVALALEKYVAFYCVASAEEALNLRLHGIEKPVLVLSSVIGADYERLIAEDIRLTVFTMAEAEAVSRAAQRSGAVAKLHLALDTGMHRIGMRPDAEGLLLAQCIAALPGVQIEGLFTHFYRADEADLSPAREQLRRYREFRTELMRRGITPQLCHVANSAGIMEQLGTELDMVRAGITMYGIYPSKEVNRSRLPLCPVLSWRSSVSYVKEIEAGDEVSYGGTFRADRRLRIATVSVGYGDGYPRMLGGRADVLIAGKRAAILGRVCMDQLMVDVSDIPEAEPGSRVTLIGRDGEEQIQVEELSSLIERFPYELICDIGRRVPRVYLQDGQITGTKDWFSDLYEDFEQSRRAKGV